MLPTDDYRPTSAQEALTTASSVIYMSIVKAIQITIDDNMLRAIDSMAAETGRSAFVRKAVQHYLDSMRQAAIDDSYRRGYSKGVRDSALAPWEGEQAWPES